MQISEGRSRRRRRHGDNTVVAAVRAWTDWWVDHPAVDYIIVLVLTALAWRTDIFRSLSPTERAVWFQTLAMVSGVLLSLGTLVVTLLFTVTPNDRLRRVVVD